MILAAERADPAATAASGDPRRLESPRLLLREVTYDDAPALFALFSDAEACRYAPAPLLRSLAATRWLIVAWDERRAEGLSSFIVTPPLRPDEVHGVVQVGRDGELGGLIVPRHSGQGLGPAAIEMVATKLTRPALWTIIDAEHAALAKALLRTGFQAERRLSGHRVHPQIGAARRDCILYRRDAASVGLQIGV